MDWVARAGERMLDAFLPTADAGACQEYYRCRCTNCICYLFHCATCAGRTNCRNTGRRC